MKSSINITVQNPSKPVCTLLKNANLFEYDIISVCFHVSWGYNGLFKSLWPQLNQISMQRVLKKRFSWEMDGPTHFLWILQ